MNGRSRNRTGGLLLIREALCQLSYPPSTSLVCPAPAGELDAHAARFGHESIVSFIADEVVYATHLPFDPGSPARGTASYVEGCWSPMLTGCHCNLGAHK